VSEEASDPVSRRERFERRRRANVAGGRQQSHRVVVTSEEEARLVQLAEAKRVTVPRLLIESAFAVAAAEGEPLPHQPDALAELFALRRLLAALSHSVIQIARHATAGNGIPADAREALIAVRRVADRLDAEMDRVAAQCDGNHHAWHANGQATSRPGTARA
jgi:hypothetical protein